MKTHNELESCQFKLSLNCAGNYSWDITSKTFKQDGILYSVDSFGQVWIYSHNILLFIQVLLTFVQYVN